MKTTTYPGQELDLFAQAVHWKAYWTSRVRPFLGEDVLEVGAGIGSNTALLRGGMPGRWVCLEPDPALAARIPDFPAAATPSRTVEVVRGALDALPSADRFDTVLYIDVLEHIADDRAELARAAQLLRPGGHLVVLAPAHPGLFSSFDEAVGHYRRYTRRSLSEISPPNADSKHFRYLDAAGVLASLANRALLGQRTPTARQIGLWDRVLVPISRRLDSVLGGRVGKSILGVWRIGNGAPEVNTPS